MVYVRSREPVILWIWISECVREMLASIEHVDQPSSSPVGLCKQHSGLPSFHSRPRHCIGPTTGKMGMHIIHGTMRGYATTNVKATHPWKLSDLATKGALVWYHVLWAINAWLDDGPLLNKLHNCCIPFQYQQRGVCFTKTCLLVTNCAHPTLSQLGECLFCRVFT